MTDQPSTSSGFSSSSSFSETSQGKSIFSKFSGLKPLSNLDEDYEEFERKRKKIALAASPGNPVETIVVVDSGPSLLDSLDSYYEGVTKSSPPAKKHCSSMAFDDLPPIRVNLIADFINGKKKEQKEQIIPKDWLENEDNSPPSSQLEAMHTSPDEIPATPPNSKWEKYRFNKDGSKFTDWLPDTPISKVMDSVPDSDQLEDSKITSKNETIININFLDKKDEPANNENESTPKRTQKAKITDFFKNKFSRD